MKRILSLILAVLLTLSMVACNSNTAPTQNMEQTMPTVAPSEMTSPTEPGVDATEPSEPTPSEPTSSGSQTCQHEYADATCNAPSTCRLCGSTSGDALGHDFVGSDCETAASCSRCGEKDTSPSGHTDGYGGICSNCGAKTERYYDIQSALKAAERYPKYIESNYNLIDNEYDLYNMTKDSKYYSDAHDHAMEIYEYLQKIIDKCEDYRELNMLTEECRELLLELPSTPTSTSSSAMRSYISSARSFARKATNVAIIYNVLCGSYELPGV